VPKKVPTRAVPSPLSAEARNFVLQGQNPPLAARPSEPPPAPLEPAPAVVVPAEPAPPTIAVVEPAPAPAPTPPAAATSRARKRSSRTLIARVDGRTLRRLQVYLDAEVAKRLKHHCVEHDVDMSAYVNEVLARALR
jgi:hypothetical protein